MRETTRKNPENVFMKFRAVKKVNRTDPEHHQDDHCFSRYGTKSHSVRRGGVKMSECLLTVRRRVEAGQTPAETNFAATLQRHLRQTLHYSCLILPLYCHHSPALVPEFNGFTTTSHASFQTFLLSILIHQSQKERISVCIQGGK